jgi:hypothetical protein
MFVAVTGITGIPENIFSSPFTLAGKVDPPDANFTTITYSIKAGSDIASLAGAVLTFSDEGTVTITATVVNGLAEGSNYTEDFEITYVDLPMFSNATFVGRFTQGNIIGFAGLDGNLDWELFTDSTFIIFGFRGSNNNTDGFGGMQIVTQFSGDSFGWNQYQTPDYTGFSNDGAEIVFYVFPMNQLLKYDEIILGTQAKIILNSGFNNYLGAWFTSASLTQGTGVMHGLGWITRNTGLTPLP